MHAALCSISLLYPTFATLTSHLFDANAAPRTWLMDYYLSARRLDIKGSTPLKELFPTLPDDMKMTLAKLLVFTPFARLGFFGQLPEAELLIDLQIIANRLQKEECVCPFNFATALTPLAKKEYMKPLFNYSSRKSNKSILKKAEAIIAGNDYCAFSVNNDAIRLAKITKLLLDIAQYTAPMGRFPKVGYHTHLFKNAFLTAEIAIPSDLLEDVRESYLFYRNFIPTCVFYSLAYQTSLGKHLVPSVEKMGFVLGFRGPHSARYSYIRSFGDTLGSHISAKYNLRYDRVCDIVFHGKNTNEAFTIADQRSEIVDIRDLPKRDNPYSKSFVEGEGDVLGKSRGTYILDHNCVDYETRISNMDHSYQFPYEVRFLTTRSRMTRSLKSSAFTRSQHQIKAFCSIVDVNDITKPDLTKRPSVKDKRWLPIFDEYLASDFTIKSLADILKRDDVYFKKIQAKLRKLAQALKGKSLKDADNLCTIGYEGLAFSSVIDQPYDVTDIDERYQMRLYKDMLDLWVQESKTPILPNPVIVTIRKLDNEKGRTVCRQPIVISIFESFANRIWQVIYQKINREMDYSVSNYLPGLAVPLYSMERLAKNINRQDFAMCNMDVKSCFDNINLLHPNFLSALEDGLRSVRNKVGSGPAQFLSTMFKDYLYTNTKLGNFQFQRSKKCPEVKIPEVGALPTGFVLSPALWLTLALPAILETHRRVKDKTLFGFDLCGDDLIALAPRGLSEKQKAKVCAPWFDLAAKLDLKYHFFKNYKDGRVNFNPKWKYLFDGPWVDRFPAYSIPVFHAGTILADKKHVETVTALDPDKAEGKLYSALSKRVRDKGANFLPFMIMNEISKHPNLNNRLEAYAPPKRLGDRGDEDQERKAFITGPQASVIPFFYRGNNHGGTGDAISKNRGWFLQIPTNLKKECFISSNQKPIKDNVSPGFLDHKISEKNYAILAGMGMSSSEECWIEPSGQDNPLFETVAPKWTRLKPLTDTGG